MKDKKSPPLKISNARKQFEVSLEKKVYYESGYYQTF